MKKNRYVVHHPDFGAFITDEIRRLSIDRESFRSACRMKQDHVDHIKKGSTITK